MKLSTKGRYAVRFMMELARRPDTQPQFLKNIARRQEISPRYLEQLVLNLKSAGLVRSIRGAKGGFILTRPADQISLLDVYRASEGSLSIVECIDNPSCCKQSAHCASRRLWEDVKISLSLILGKKTLADLARQQNRLETDA